MLHHLPDSLAASKVPGMCHVRPNGDTHTGDARGGAVGNPKRTPRPKERPVSFVKRVFCFSFFRALGGFPSFVVE